METITTKSASETQILGEKLSKKILSSSARRRLGASILCLYGDLGSGKTTFVQGLAKGLGIEKRIISPTFVIIRQYVIPNAKGVILNSVQDLEILKQVQNDNKRVQHDREERAFYHVDLYRCETEKDLEGIGIKEILENPENIVVIEWPEKLGSLLPKKRTDITFEYVGQGERKISVKI